MRYESQIVYGKPCSKKNHYRAGVNKAGVPYIFKDSILQEYERSFVAQCGDYWGRRISVPFIVYFAAYLDNPKADLDNIVTTALDALQEAEAITDDNLCMKIVCEKRKAKGSPRVQFAIETLYDEPNLF